MRLLPRYLGAAAALFCLAGAATPRPAIADPPITLAYSDWPGWTCWDIAMKEGFFAKHHVNVKLVWFPNYSDSLNALAAGQVRQLPDVERHHGPARIGRPAHRCPDQR
jgi:NitT/TauT family transport system substrate-binding protein